MAPFTGLKAPAKWISGNPCVVECTRLFGINDNGTIVPLPPTGIKTGNSLIFNTITVYDIFSGLRASVCSWNRQGNDKTGIIPNIFRGGK
jgi:hypothetical protein